MKSKLQIWLAFVASLRLLSVYFGYFSPEMLKDNVFDNSSDSEMTNLVGRCFAIWTTVTCAITLTLAVKIESKPLYFAVMMSFLIALIFFALELFVYETVSKKAVISPGVIASLSLLFMTGGYSSIFPKSHTA